MTTEALCHKTISKELTCFAWLTYVLIQLQNWKNVDRVGQEYVESVLNDRLNIQTLNTESKLLLCNCHFVHSFYHATVKNYEKSMQSLQNMMNVIESNGTQNMVGFQKCQTFGLLLLAHIELKMLLDNEKLPPSHGHACEHATNIAVHIIHGYILSKRGFDNRLNLWAEEILKSALEALDDLVSWSTVQQKVAEHVSSNHKHSKISIPDYEEVTKELQNLELEESNDKKSVLDMKVNGLLDWIENELPSIETLTSGMKFIERGKDCLVGLVQDGYLDDMEGLNDEDKENDDTMNETSSNIAQNDVLNEIKQMEKNINMKNERIKSVEQTANVIKPIHTFSKEPESMRKNFKIVLSLKILVSR